MQLQHSQLSLAEKGAEMRKALAESEKRERALEGRLLSDLRVMESKYTALMDKCVSFVLTMKVRLMRSHRYEAKLKSKQDARDVEEEQKRVAEVTSLTSELQALNARMAGMQRELEETKVELMRAQQAVPQTREPSELDKRAAQEELRSLMQTLALRERQLGSW